MDEFSFIRDFLAPLSDPESSVGLQDDAALLRVPEGRELVISKDILVEGVHFFPEDAIDRVARKAIRVNVSDIVAKGAEPFGYFLGLALERGPDQAFAEALNAGLALDQTTYDLKLLGGDTTRSKAGLMLSVTMVGLVDKGRSKTRLTAKEGDRLYVSGTLGDAALGLKLRLEPDALPALSEEARSALLKAYEIPEPPLLLGPVIADYATAAMDISDGIFGDLAHLCRASRLSAEIDLDNLPLSEAAQEACRLRPDFLALARKGGDDYQTLCTVSPEHETLFLDESEHAGVVVTPIGRLVSPAEGCESLIKINGVEGETDIMVGGYTHF